MVKNSILSEEKAKECYDKALTRSILVKAEDEWLVRPIFVMDAHLLGQQVGFELAIEMLKTSPCILSCCQNCSEFAAKWLESKIK